MIKKILKWTSVSVLILLVLFVALNWAAFKEVYRQKHMYSDPHFDTERVVLPELTGEKKLLVFSKTNGWRHFESIDAAKEMFGELANENDWAVFSTENNTVFNNEQLAQFDAVVLQNSSGTLYTDEQKAAFKRFVENGGGVVALHAAGGDPSYEWAWYPERLIGAQFMSHPMKSHIQEATLNVEVADHPVMAGLSNKWVRSDEWYNFSAPPSDRSQVLMTIDETTYDPEANAMGGYHPMTWVHQIGDGRVFYTALGHIPETYSEPKYRTLVTQAVNWVTADPKSDEEGSTQID